MGRPEAARRLIVNADDFGRSHSINQAVIRAHREGILTTASLMVNGEAAEEAIELSRCSPELGVGLHLSLICGTSALEPAEIPDLVKGQRHFSNNPIRAGLLYFFRRAQRPQLEREIKAQFQKFRASGLKLDHVNGHLHFHMHPIVFGILAVHAREWGITHFRLTRDLFWLNLRLAHGHLFYRATHALVFSLLSLRARPVLRGLGIKHTAVVFGLLQNAHVDENYLSGLLEKLPPGDSELYSHPSLGEFKREFEALISPRVREIIARHRIQQIRYQDL
jgi:hopanoid biosynthesis associated protein HpnK